MSLHCNTLYYGDNLQIMRALPAESVDLIYLDPPFNSKANYNVFFGEGKDKAQNEAFRDTWSWCPEHKTLYNDLIANEEGRQTEATIKTLKGLYQILGSCGMLSYLLYMQVRLVEMWRLLKPTGSLYLHCDPTASHFLKLILDSIFGKDHFRNEIVWHYPSMSRNMQDFPKKHDIIFRYTVGAQHKWNWEDVLTPYKESTVARAKYGGAGFARREGKAGYLTRSGKIPDTVWDIPHIKSKKEALGYPTQKPLALLERIVKASSCEGDVVLDPFCGCGTTLDAAESLKRRWIGVDNSHLAIEITERRLNTRASSLGKAPSILPPLAKERL